MNYSDLSPVEQEKREVRTLAEHPQEAQDFIDSTHNFNGASMNLKSMKMPQPGDKMFIVGGETSKNTGKRVDTEYVDQGSSSPRLEPRQFAKHFNRLKMEAGDPKAMMGSWIDTKSKKNTRKGVQIDMSTGHINRKPAEDKMLERGEDAIWNMGSMRNIRNEAVRKRRGTGPR